jgi:hypothetical protein
MSNKDVNIGVGGKIDRLPIRQFNFSQFVISPAIVMIAKRGSGKSWVTRALLEYFKDIPMGCVIAPTDRNNCFYGNFFPETYIHYHYKTEIIERILARQEKIKEKATDKLKLGITVDTRTYIVMDDCLASKGCWIRDQPLQEILFNGRHSEIMYILTMQFPLGITPELRGNFDYIFLLAEDFISNLKRIYDHYAGMFPTFESFRQVFGQLTDDFGAMVIVNRGVRKTFLEKVYWYKAPDLSKLKTNFGHKQFMDYHNNNYDPNWRKKNGSWNADDYMMRKKKNKSRITVDKLKEETVEKKPSKQMTKK